MSNQQNDKIYEAAYESFCDLYHDYYHRFYESNALSSLVNEMMSCEEKAASEEQLMDAFDLLWKHDSELLIKDRTEAVKAFLIHKKTPRMNEGNI